MNRQKRDGARTLLWAGVVCILLACGLTILALAAIALIVEGIGMLCIALSLFLLNREQHTLFKQTDRQITQYIRQMEEQVVSVSLLTEQHEAICSILSTMQELTQGTTAEIEQMIPQLNTAIIQCQNAKSRYEGYIQGLEQILQERHP